MSDKAEEFKDKLQALLEKFEVGIQGTMYFQIGEDKLVLSTEQAPPAPTEDCNCSDGDECNSCP